MMSYCSWLMYHTKAGGLIAPESSWFYSVPSHMCPSTNISIKPNLHSWIQWSLSNCLDSGDLVEAHQLKYYRRCISVAYHYCNTMTKFYIVYRTHCKISRSMCLLCEFDGAWTVYSNKYLLYRSDRQSGYIMDHVEVTLQSHVLTLPKIYLHCVQVYYNLLSHLCI
jgi:hypothetical protein